MQRPTTVDETRFLHFVFLLTKRYFTTVTVTITITVAVVLAIKWMLKPITHFICSVEKAKNPIFATVIITVTIPANRLGLLPIKKCPMQQHSSFQIRLRDWLWGWYCCSKQAFNLEKARFFPVKQRQVLFADVWYVQSFQLGLNYRVLCSFGICPGFRGDFILNAAFQARICVERLLLIVFRCVLIAVSFHKPPRQTSRDSESCE